MAKINVYLPDELAAAVRAAGLPVSPVCQQALATAVRRVTRARQAIGAIRDPGFEPGRHLAMAGRVEDRMTLRLVEALRLARRAGGGRTGTGQLVLGVLGEGHNLGVRLLQAVDIEPDELAVALRHADLAEPAASPPPGESTTPPGESTTPPGEGTGPPGEGTGPPGESTAPPGESTAPPGEGTAPPGEGTGPPGEGTAPPGEGTGAAAGPVLGPDLTRPAWRAIATALEAAIDLGHSYLGCEHLVLGLVAEPDSAAGRVLRELGADPAAARKVLGSMLAGYPHGRAAPPPADAGVIGEILRRLDALEARAEPPGAVSR